MKKVGINGFGRIGTTLTRLLWESTDFDLVAINDPLGKAESFAYRLKYDSIYGKFRGEVSLGCDGSLKVVGDKSWRIMLSNAGEWPREFWNNAGCEVVFDCSGRSKWNMKDRSVELNNYKIIVSGPCENADYCAVAGLKIDDLKLSCADVVSCSSCDANALAPLLNAINKYASVNQCIITTLHPWLGHQRLTDGFVDSALVTSEFPESLGRAASACVMPKETSVGRVLMSLLPDLNSKIHAFSFRVPTSAVTYAIVSLSLQRIVDIDAVIKTIREVPGIVVSRDRCVSSDYIGSRSSVIIEEANLVLTGPKTLRLVVAYDNEWGYCCQILKVLGRIQ
jgi:glyceraldehyde 3-phosphate dehydrogenase